MFDDYLNHPKKIKSFFETYPFHKKSADSYITSFQFNGKRDQTVELLKAFNKNFDAEEITMRQIEKIRNKDTLTVVTGQQLTIYGGPLFTVYKIMSAIVQARKLEKMYNRTVIPVFWLADEDHDYEEASRLGILDRDDWHLLSFQLPENNHQLVGRIVLDEDFKSFREEIKKYLFDTDFTGELTNLLDTCYRPGSSFREAFGKLILKLFAKHGLVLAG
ncbi:MAG: bacillithiol biosynthesis BshC, partial [Balneolaceae bacterium]